MTVACEVRSVKPRGARRATASAPTAWSRKSLLCTKPLCVIAGSVIELREQPGSRVFENIVEALGQTDPGQTAIPASVRPAAQSEPQGDELWQRELSVGQRRARGVAAGRH